MSNADSVISLQILQGYALNGSPSKQDQNNND